MVVHGQFRYNLHQARSSAPLLAVSIRTCCAEAALVGHLLHMTLGGQLLQLRLLVVQQLGDLRTGTAGLAANMTGKGDCCRLELSPRRREPSKAGQSSSTERMWQDSRGAVCSRACSSVCGCTIFDTLKTGGSVDTASSCFSLHGMHSPPRGNDAPGRGLVRLPAAPPASSAPAQPTTWWPQLPRVWMLALTRCTYAAVQWSASSCRLQLYRIGRALQRSTTGAIHPGPEADTIGLQVRITPAQRAMTICHTAAHRLLTVLQLDGTTRWLHSSCPDGSCMT